jgi:hypothetical protein
MLSLSSLFQTPTPDVKFEEDIPIPEIELPTWLKQEDLLRDEGVLFGLSGSEPTEKIKIIESTYEQVLASPNQKKMHLHEKIGELNLILEQKNKKLEDNQLKISQTLSLSTEPHGLLRVSIGLALAIFMCFANYFLIKDGIQYAYPKDANWIAWGVFLSGMFSLYAYTALIHTNEPVTWRRALEEWGMPLAASLFLLAQIWPHFTWYKAMAYFTFTLFLFLLTGKLLLSTISKWKWEWDKFKNNWSLNRNKKLAHKEWPSTSDALEKEMEEIRIQKWNIVQTLNEVEAQIQRITAEKESAIHLFLSEYQLAKQYRFENAKIVQK